MLKKFVLLLVISGSVFCVGNQTAASAQNANESHSANRNLPVAESTDKAPDTCEPCKTLASYQQPPPDPRWFLKPEWMIVWVTLAYTFISVLALVVIGVQVWTTKDAAKRQLRAYIVPERGTIANVADPLEEETLEGMGLGEARVVNPNIGPSANIWIKNTGQTPSFDVQHSCTISLREFPLASPLIDVPFDNLCVIILGPQVGAGLTVNLPNRLNDFSIQSLRHNTYVIYLQGVIRYTDIFGDKHTTHYRLMHSLSGAKIGRSTDLVFCAEGNYGD